MRNLAFIDGQNLRFGTTLADDPWVVDLNRFRVYLNQKYKVDEAYYFIGYRIPKHTKLYRTIERAGYILVFRTHSESIRSNKKGNVDTDIIFSVMQKIADREEFDKVILVSGDGDYVKMVKYLIEKERLEKLLAPNEKNMSSLYKSLHPKYYAFLNSPQIKKKIGVSGTIK